MAIRNIREDGDDVLRKVCKPVTKMTERLSQLIDDMFDTMYEANGVGLAAPQVGVLRRMFVVQIEEDKLYELINPEGVETEGDQYGEEGCLSVPGRAGRVVRPERVTVRAQDRFGEAFELNADGMLAVCLCHEIDHLDGIMYVDKMIEDCTEEMRERGAIQ